MEKTITTIKVVCLNRLCNQDCEKCIEVQEKNRAKPSGKMVRMDDLEYFRKLWNEVEERVRMEEKARMNALEDFRKIYNEVESGCKS